MTTQIEAMKMALAALAIGQDAFNQAFSGYGFYRPNNPHNFFPDPESCTPEEIANHSAACEAYDKGAYVPDHSNGWLSPEVHVTKAPWGIGTYTDECEEIEEAITALRAAIEAAEKVEPCGKIVKATGSLKDMHIITWEDWYRPECGDKLYTNPPSAEIEELRRDAARYQWLKKHKFRWNGHCWHSQFGDVLRHTDIDAAIDSAMQEKQP